MSAKLTVPDDLLVAPGLNESDCRIELAVRLSALQRITLRQALRMSRLHRFELDEELLRRGLRV